MRFPRAMVFGVLISFCPSSWAQAQNSAQSFADMFASVLQRENPDGAAGRAQNYLTLSGSPTAALQPVINQYRLLVVPGFLSACAPQAEAFQEARKHLEEKHNVQTEYEQVPDDTSEHNGEMIANYIRTHASGNKYIVVGHSKGAVDLQMALEQPGVAPMVAALVTVAGAVGGSHIADLPEEPSVVSALEHTLECTGKIGAALHSLQTPSRQAFNASHPKPAVPSYSLVAVSSALQTSVALSPTWLELSAWGELKQWPGYNRGQDGLLMAAEGILPGATDLGTAIADHVAVAHDFAGTPLAVAFNHNNFPRAALLEALLRFVVSDLQK